MRKVVLCSLFLLVVLSLSVSVLIDYNSSKIDIDDFFITGESELKKSNYLQKYYGSLFYYPLNGEFTQLEVTKLLNHYIEKDLSKNNGNSNFDFLVGKQTLFYYTVDISTGSYIFSFLVERENMDFPKKHFISVTLFLNAWPIDVDKINDDFIEGVSYGDVYFNNEDDLVSYINTYGNGSVFFERGWLNLTK